MQRLRWATVLFAACAFSCGAESDRDSIGTRVAALVGGVEAPEATAIVFVLDQDDGSSCSGALIAPNVVLATRTCISEGPMGGDCQTPLPAPKPASKIKVSNAQDVGTGPAFMSVSRIAITVDTATCGNDLALLVLAEAMPATGASPLEPRLDQPIAQGELFTAFGYGATSPGSTNTIGVRRKLDGVQVTCAASCPESAPSEWTSGPGPCFSDGPGVDGDGRLMGTASRLGSSCESAVFEGFGTHASWIRSEVIIAASEAGYPAPSWAAGDSGTVDGGGAGGAAGNAGAGAAGNAGAGAAGTAGAGAAGTAGAGAGGLAGAAATPETGVEDSGCSCRAARTGMHGGWLLTAFAAIALGVLRKAKGQAL